MNVYTAELEAVSKRDNVMVHKPKSAKVVGLNENILVILSKVMNVDAAVRTEYVIVTVLLSKSVIAGN